MVQLGAQLVELVRHRLGDLRGATRGRPASRQAGPQQRHQVLRVTLRGRVGTAGVGTREGRGDPKALHEHSAVGVPQQQLGGERLVVHAVPAGALQGLGRLTDEAARLGRRQGRGLHQLEQGAGPGVVLRDEPLQAVLHPDVQHAGQPGVLHQRGAAGSILCRGGAGVVRCGDPQVDLAPQGGVLTHPPFGVRDLGHPPQQAVPAVDEGAGLQWEHDVLSVGCARRARCAPRV